MAIRPGGKVHFSFRDLRILDLAPEFIKVSKLGPMPVNQRPRLWLVWRAAAEEGLSPLAHTPSNTRLQPQVRLRLLTKEGVRSFPTSSKGAWPGRDQGSGDGLGMVLSPVKILRKAQEMRGGENARVDTGVHFQSHETDTRSCGGKLTALPQNGRRTMRHSRRDISRVTAPR